MEALIMTRKDYCKIQSMKIFLLGISIFVFVINVAFVLTIINSKLKMTSDIIIFLISLLPISFTASILIIRKMCEAPLFNKLFVDKVEYENFDDDEEDEKYYDIVQR